MELKIIDDGKGLGPDPRAGVGFNSMRERAAELGSICTIESASGGGVRVHTRLLCPQEPVMETLRVAIADDHPVFLDGLRALLSSLPDVEVVGEASTREEAVALVQRVQPDVVAMDLNMPVVNDIEATRRIIEKDPTANVLMLTMFEDDDSVFAAIRAGARGYLVKGSKQKKLSGPSRRPEPEKPSSAHRSRSG